MVGFDLTSRLVRRYAPMTFACRLGVQRNSHQARLICSQVHLRRERPVPPVRLATQYAVHPGDHGKTTSSSTDSLMFLCRNGDPVIAGEGDPRGLLLPPQGYISVYLWFPCSVPPPLEVAANLEVHLHLTLLPPRRNGRRTAQKHLPPCPL
jgi:hypothetical protein